MKTKRTWGIWNLELLYENCQIQFSFKLSIFERIPFGKYVNDEKYSFFKLRLSHFMLKYSKITVWKHDDNFTDCEWVSCWSTSTLCWIYTQKVPKSLSRIVQYAMTSLEMDGTFDFDCHSLNPISTRLCHVIYYYGDKNILA